MYNGVDKNHYKPATDKLNDLFNNEKWPKSNRTYLPYNKDIREIDEDSEVLMLEKLAEKKAHKSNIRKRCKKPRIYIGF